MTDHIKCDKLVQKRLISVVFRDKSTHLEHTVKRCHLKFIK